MSCGPKPSKAARQEPVFRRGDIHANRASSFGRSAIHPENWSISKDYILYVSLRNDQNPGAVPTTVGVNRTDGTLSAPEALSPQLWG